MLRSWRLCLPLLLCACEPGRIPDKSIFLACMLDVETEIFVPKCGSSGCHSATSPQNGLDLVSTGVGMRVTTGTSMCAGKPLSSFMLEKLGPSPQCGQSMPLGDPLTPIEVKCVTEYLEEQRDGGA
jgi:hypothetical protein